MQSLAPMVEIISSLEAFEIIKMHFNPFAEEVWVLALNSKLNLLGKEMIFRGTVDSCPIHPRDIFRYLIAQNATAYILVHNHPSQDAYPSPQDLKITKKLRTMSNLLEIKMLDHLIITKEKYFSFADGGLLSSIGPSQALR